MEYLPLLKALSMFFILLIGLVIFWKTYDFIKQIKSKIYYYSIILKFHHFCMKENKVFDVYPDRFYKEFSKAEINYLAENKII